MTDAHSSVDSCPYVTESIRVMLEARAGIEPANKGFADLSRLMIGHGFYTVVH
jgi:hypothetical protein